MEHLKRKVFATKPLTDEEKKEFDFLSLEIRKLDIGYSASTKYSRHSLPQFTDTTID
jgi:hypothetical protein